MMKNQVIKQFGDESVFELLETPKPAVKPGFVLVRVMATSVNPVDLKIRSGEYAGIAPEFPAVLNSDVAGIIEEVGANVTSFKIGDEVYGCAGGLKGEAGALSEFMLVDARLLSKKPESLSMSEAAALPLVAITAWEALMEKVKLTPKQKVLIHAGAGGVGHIAIQLAKYAGAEVYATVSSPEKAAIAKSLGATDTINYREEKVEDYVKRITDGQGFDVVLDTVGGDNLTQSLLAVKLYGDVVTILASSTHDLSPLFSKSANLHVVFMLVPLLFNMQRERHGDILRQVAELVDKGKLKPLIDQHKFTFAEVGKAHALLASGKAIGKIVLQG
jgi:NADPH2:quinone reductase